MYSGGDALKKKTEWISTNADTSTQVQCMIQLSNYHPVMLCDLPKNAEQVQLSLILGQDGKR